ncbi:MAG: toll/interleukin-1 receptor domain-containing protein [Paramuribaculum sp.]|nr:toll/interleukin-1 receptor domain-containing protein [Paramuribaculum sp.]
MAHQYKYFAFISYNSKDLAWGKRLQRKLEHFRIPSTLCSQRGWKRKPINPVFFAPTDIQPGGLTDELKHRLEASKNLIVICSPNSAKSEWVGTEIEYFHELGRSANIHFFIIDGIPNSGNPDTECFNPVVKKLGLPEILGANIHEKIYRWSWLNRERAYVQIISKLLDVEFDTIWKRHRRRLISQLIAWMVAISAVLTAMIMIWANSQPFNTSISIREASIHNSSLPTLSNAVVTLSIDKETKTDTIANENDNAEFLNIPHKYLGKEARIICTCPDYLPVDTTVRLERNITVNLSRNPTVYGNIRTELWDFKRNIPVKNTKVIIDRWEIQSDSEGIVRKSVPLELQKTHYSIHIPEYNISDTIAMPTNDYHSIGIN